MAYFGQRGHNILLCFKVTVFLSTKSQDIGVGVEALTIMDACLPSLSAFIGLDSDNSGLSEDLCLGTEEAEGKWWKLSLNG